MSNDNPQVNVPGIWLRAFLDLECYAPVSHHFSVSARKVVIGAIVLLDFVQSFVHTYVKLLEFCLSKISQNNLKVLFCYSEGWNFTHVIQSMLFHMFL